MIQNELRQYLLLWFQISQYGDILTSCHQYEKEIFKKLIRDSLDSEQIQD